MGELWRLIAAEGLYQYMREKSLKMKTLLSREQFCAMQHTVVVNVDQLLYLMRIEIVPIPDTRGARSASILHPSSRN
jgi:hypothetical protein